MFCFLFNTPGTPFFSPLGTSFFTSFRAPYFLVQLTLPDDVFFERSVVRLVITWSINLALRSWLAGNHRRRRSPSILDYWSLIRLLI
jgi:hypothetical protein